MTGRYFLRSGAAALALVAGTSGAFAQDADRISQLEARIAQLESQSASSGTDVSFGSGMQTSVEVYGFVKVDFIYDFDYELGNSTFPLAYFGTASQPEEDGAFNATAQQTQLGFRTTTPTQFGDLGTVVEIDFYGASGSFGLDNSYEPRARSIYAELGGFLIGKHWTTFVPLSSYPATLDFQGIAGIPFARQEQIRYTANFGNFIAEAAIEQSNANSDSPVAVAALSYDTDPLLLRVAGLYGTVDYENADGNDRSADAYGINLSGTAQLWDGATLDASYAFGEGIASYLVNLGDDLTEDGDPIEMQAAYVSLSQDVGENLTLRAMYGWRDNDEQGVSGNVYDFETLTTTHLHAIYSLTENSSVGIEYFRGTNDTFGGEEFEVDRLQTSFRVTF